jgi:hypothetical protein
MMPEPIPHPKAIPGQKKKAVPAPLPPSRPAVAFNSEIDIINMPQPALLNGPYAPPQTRRAIDYEPPASFVQNMERPGPGRQMGTTGAKGNILADLWSFN